MKKEETPRDIEKLKVEAPFQYDIWGYVLGFEADNGFTPTREEMSAHFKCTKQNITQAVNNLVLRGYFKLSADFARNIRIITLK